MQECALVPVPHPELKVFELDAKATAVKGKMGAAYATEHAYHPLGKSLTGLWEGLHQLQEPKPQSLGMPGGEKKSECLVAGRCLCNGGGKQLKRLRAQLHSVLKSLCAGPNKSLLIAGKIVLHIANVEGSSDWNTEQDDGIHYLFGVAMMYLKPYRATLERLKPSSIVEPCLVNPPPSLRHVKAWHKLLILQLPYSVHIWVTSLKAEIACSEAILLISSFVGTRWTCLQTEATAEFLSELEALALLDLTQNWHLQAYSLLESNTPVLDMRPLDLAVKPLGAGTQLWPPAKRPSGALCTHVGWDVMLSSLYTTAASLDDDDAESIGEEMHEDEEEDVLDGGTTALVHQYECLEEMIAERESDAHTLLAATTAATAADVPEAQVSPRASSAVALEPGPRVYLGREAALASIVVEGSGKISFHSSKQAFEGRCFRHPQCTMSRSCIRSKRCNGRPLGLMLSWLLAHELEETAHKDKEQLKNLLSLEKRQQARATLESLQGSSALLGLEHPAEATEPVEPESLRGLM
eukprot:6464849-Amphidinium_carterae.1